jgi:DNA-binding HxlR family transcriptional regulator
MLTQTLRRLEASGLVEHTVHAQVPVRVDYALTPLGATLVGPIAVLTEWATRHGAAVTDAQERSARAPS